MGDADIRVVSAWHAALNDGDVDRLLALMDPGVEVGGPRGAARGADVLRAWAGRANIQLAPRRIFGQADTVVVEQGAEWRDPDTGAVTGRDTAACVFVVRHGRIARVARYPDLAQALSAAGLHEGDEVTGDGDAAS